MTSAPPPPAIVQYIASRPTVPAELGITQELWERLLCDPVKAAECILGVSLDAFQQARLRYYWWCQNMIDSSGVGTGKTIVIFVFLCLRCILLPNQICGIYYPTFGTGKNEFWNYFSKFMLANKRIFLAQLGNPLKTKSGEELDGDGTVHGADCYKAYFLNGNQLLMPAPSFMKDAVTQASLSLTTLVVEEWPQIDKSSDGINKQLIDRTRAASWNQHHPIWGNHILFSGHAQTRLHLAAARYYSHQRKVNAGDPTFANISYNYKDYSNLITSTGKTFKAEHRFESTIANKRNASSKIEWMGQWLGVWGQNGEGWFTEDAIMRAHELGRRMGLLPVLDARQWEELYPS